jgi:hypothetical protein
MWVDVTDAVGIDYRTKDTMKITQEKARIEQHTTDNLLDILLDNKLAMRK